MIHLIQDILWCLIILLYEPISTTIHENDMRAKANPMNAVMSNIVPSSPEKNT
jgi:hypothetical protein